MPCRYPHIAEVVIQEVIKHEGNRLNNSFELATDETVPVLNDVGCSDWTNVHAIGVYGLEASLKYIQLTFAGEERMSHVPSILNYPK